MSWTKFIIAAWGLVLGQSVLQSNLPASWWFEPGAVRVEDAVYGECPVLNFDREINRPFRADWTVTVLRRSPSGGWYTFGTYQGSNDYRPDNSLPDDLDLCWWTWQTELQLLPGEYRVNTLWVVMPPNGGPREIRRTSNAFNVSAKE